MEPMSDERSTDARRERLLIGVQRLAELEKKIIDAQRELTEAALRFQNSEQDSTPEVSRGNQQAVDVGRAEYGKVIGRIGTQACPGFFKARICEARCKIDGR